MNEIVNKFLLVVDKFMAEMHSKQSASFDKSCFTYGACGPVPKNKERIEKFIQTAKIQTSFIKMNLIKHVFNMIYGLWQIKRFSKRNTIR